MLGIALENRLDPAYQALYDDLLIDALVLAGRRPELIDRLSQIAPGARSATVRRRLETAQTAALQRAAAARDARQALSLWSGVIRAQGSSGFVAMFTERVSRIALASGQSTVWRTRLRDGLRFADPENAPVIEAESKRLDAAKR